MPRGYPDFFGSATFFKFGNLRAENTSEDVGSGITENLIDVAYKGKTYGGYIRFHIDDIDDVTTFIVTLDGEIVSTVGLPGMKNFAITDITQQLLRLTLYEYDGNDIVCNLSIAPDITFDYQFKIDVTNGSIGTTKYTGMIIMAEVA